jgi:cell division protein ZipA
MDKDLIRIIIFAIGLLVIIGMIGWSYLKHEKAKQSDYDDYDGSLLEDENSELGGYDSSLDDPEAYAEVEYDDRYDERGDETEPNPVKPGYAVDRDATLAEKKLSIIQFSIVAPTEAGFNGIELFGILDDAGLEYGNLQIFERLDARRLVDFGVASMVKPGIIPSINLAAFHTPGIVFFMQPGKLDNPVLVFNDFVRTFTFVAERLNGIMKDHHREPLTDETIEKIRQSLVAA